MKIYIKSFLKYKLLFCYGGMLYMTIEMLFRNRTSYYMGLCGGLAFLFIGCLNNFISWDMPFVLQCLIGGLFIITPLEYIFGILFNQTYNIWDYRDIPININGQICMPFSLIWCMISAVAIVTDDYLRYFIFEEDKPAYKLFWLAVNDWWDNRLTFPVQ